MVGAFGVPKKNEFLRDDRPVLRFILNAIPSNVIQKQLMGDLRTLPYHGQWASLDLSDEGHFLTWSEEDMVSAFYLFRLCDVAFQKKVHEKFKDTSL